jgi:transposase InsO family protein
MKKKRQRPSEGPGGGERSEPEPGPSDGRGAAGGPPGRGLGRGTGTGRTYTPEERRWALEAWEKSGLGLDVFARQWGITGPTLREWKKAYDRAGPKGLEHPTATGRARGRARLAAPVAAEIVQTRRSFPDFGLRKIRDYLLRFAGLRVSAGGVRAVLRREGLPPAVPPRRRGRGRPAVRRFERARPGELWQSDITSFRLARESRPVYLIVWLDDHSRYVVSWGLYLRQTGEIPIETLLDGVQKYGKPKEVLTDQGRQYFAWRGKTAFQKLLVREGIQHVVARAHHPETVGKCERLWETVGRELWDRVHPQDLAEARERLGHYFHHYNFFRPHQSLDGMVPADRFFGAESDVRQAIETSVSRNALRLALGEHPRKPVYLVGQVDGEVVSLHGERGRLVVATRQGERSVDIQELGIRKEADDDDDGHGADGGRDPGAGRGGAADAGVAQEAGARPRAAGGLPDPGAVGRGERGGASTGPGAVCDDPGGLARRHPEDRGGEEARDAAASGVAAEPAGGGGDGLRPPHAAADAREAPFDERPGERPGRAAEADPPPRAGARVAHVADRRPAGAPGEPGPGTAPASEGPRGGGAADGQSAPGAVEGPWTTSNDAPEDAPETPPCGGRWERGCGGIAPAEVSGRRSPGTSS